MSGTTAVLCLYLVYGLMQQMEASILSCIPRKTVTYQNGNIKTFMKPGLSNFSTLLVSEETDTLFVGARDAIFALDLNDISREIASEDWFATRDRQLECVRRGKDKVDCRNYILLLHKINDTNLYVCGTNAFYPACDYMVINSTDIHLQGKAEESRGRCPFEPTLKYASLLVDSAFYSATSNNFLGTEPIILRSLRNHLRTEFKASWLNEPSFVYMDMVQESESNPDGDDDKIYVFFTETAVEFEFYDKLLVSRIARVCKGDLGGKRILQKRWTSFLKSRLTCSVPESNFQFNIVQDVFLLKRADWRESMFYGIFTQQWGRLDISAVCAFSMKTVQEVFAKGNYKGPVTVEHSHVKWMVFTGEVPLPRPGACIDNFARSIGYNTSLDLPDKILQFVRDHPLMDNAVNPVGDRPVLLKRGSNYTRIVVDRITGLDKKTYDVLFIGTDNGYLHKALNCDGEMFIMEEIQLFQSPEPVQSLKLSSRKGLLYVGSPSQVVQLPVSVCSRYKHCLDCVLARDPYCAWSESFEKCVLVANQTGDLKDLIQSVKNGDASRCPKVGNNVRNCPVIIGNSVHLKCAPMSNLARMVWKFNGSSLQAEDSKYLLYDGGIVIFNVTVADAGFYDCHSVERANGKEFPVTVASYVLYTQKDSVFIITKNYTTNQPNADTTLKVKSLVSSSLLTDPAKQKSLEDQKEKLILKLLGAGFALLFSSLLVWNFCKGHLSVPWKSRERSSKTANADCLPGPTLATEGSGAVRKSSATRTNTSTVNESVPLVSSPSEEERSANVQHNTSLTKRSGTCSSQSCLVEDETMFPIEECGM
ncbi:semaphorin-4E isoform X1 [Chelonia mydas]|uniref:semaphorin-4E isoform X1 n=2 Tax=Chelonia mydas TaxID=8469 RepID=UPI00042C2821|nr:semaphorin-4E isoform X1 [Chelonia mydas]XP_043392035.1 semaphorin-4E isoform X1 [Chelonia mydas]